MPLLCELDNKVVLPLFPHCSPSPVTAAASTYQFDGTGFAEMEPLQSKFRSGKGLALFFEFKTVWKDAVLFFVANENNVSYLLINNSVLIGKILYSLSKEALLSLLICFNVTHVQCMDWF